ncbi:YbhB/YbcL family Raf kinase inhibitor-like protein [Levilactobacillus brevis]|uniref:Raf-like protein n=2 Tax=Levilactobacillus brevis TaxID=1580 RepID=U2R2I2_LEVBR|nr:YbhB/YbcL family Raf kinase inhibitor-like protein [Levilactobacillus brevis]ERK44887.1 Raf-like protein [Levilactobacillus brevis ATCC 14869 = DSM 20054]KIO98957.1 Phospholipid-binding protein [Levilactobacillus brevis]KRK20602.1 phospholipid-binding protein [Levilactobacillus brevis ATCC 14869 = DSM 20054]MCT3571112.1 YbhB/YbcL family Raf kinase inhibitor-like protein [Levilactobacillus brevis]MCT3572022.1 YbhB/YbcL family Raf kinase inhibitor-like protein [Levilactobacillus brevis]
MQIQVPFALPNLPDEYGINQPADELVDGINLRSFPFTVTDLPKAAVTVAFSLIDHDTIPVVGFSWIHWLGANLPVTAGQVVVPDNASQTTTFTQGTNTLPMIIDQIHQPTDFKQRGYDLTKHYAGPRPRGGVHAYRLTVTAVDTTLPVTSGYLYNEFLRMVEGHVVAQTHVNLLYAKK